MFSHLMVSIISGHFLLILKQMIFRGNDLLLGHQDYFDFPLICSILQAPRFFSFYSAKISILYVIQLYPKSS